MQGSPGTGYWPGRTTCSTMLYLRLCAGCTAASAFRPRGKREPQSHPDTLAFCFSSRTAPAAHQSSTRCCAHGWMIDLPACRYISARQAADDGDAAGALAPSSGRVAEVHPKIAQGTSMTYEYGAGFAPSKMGTPLATSAMSPATRIMK